LKLNKIYLIIYFTYAASVRYGYGSMLAPKLLDLPYFAI